MSSTNKSDLNQSFKKVCIEFEIPKNIQTKLIDALCSHFNNPRLAKKAAIELFPYNWSNDLISPVLEKNNQKNSSENQIEFVIKRIRRLSNLSRFWRDTKRTKSTLPYIKVDRGTTIYICPIHKEYHGDILPIDDELWSQKPLGEDIYCSCAYRRVTKYEFNDLKNNNPS